MSLENINLATSQVLDSLTKDKIDALSNTTGPDYPNVHPISLPGGSFYIDSSPGKENINIRHKSGSFITFESNGDIFIRPAKDLKVVSERNIAVKSGTSIKDNGGSDKCVIQVVGDAHLQVQNDLHVEVWGNKYETVNKNSFLTVKGDYTIVANNINTKASGVHTEDAYEKVNKNTFQTNKIGVPSKDGVGGQIKDIIFGNRVIEMADPRGTFSLISAGHMEIIVKQTMKQAIGGAYVGSVVGTYSENVGGTMDFKVGGASNLNVGGAYNVTVGGIMKVTAAQIFLN